MTSASLSLSADTSSDTCVSAIPGGMSWFRSTSLYAHFLVERLCTSTEMMNPALDLIEELVKRARGTDTPGETQSPETTPPETPPIILPSGASPPATSKAHTMRCITSDAADQGKACKTQTPGMAPAIMQAASQTFLPCPPPIMDGRINFAPFWVTMRLLSHDFKVPPGLPTPVGRRCVRLFAENFARPPGLPLPKCIFALRQEHHHASGAMVSGMRSYQVGPAEERKCTRKELLAVLAEEDDVFTAGFPSFAACLIIGPEAELRKLPKFHQAWRTG